MADGSLAPTVTLHRSIRDIGRDAWDRLANPTPQTHNPFVSYDFLSALEESRSAAPESGWAARHVVLAEGGEILGTAPLYLKSHSLGEYVFDHHWADAYERAGGRYYPKLLCAVPFTPVTGPRLLAPDAAARRMLASALAQLAAESRISSLHANFFSEAESIPLEQAGFLVRTGVQYRWRNKGYRSFDDFLGQLSSRKRKAIRKERRAPGQAGISIRILGGAEISPAHWDSFWIFYQDTGARKWGSPYLTRACFSQIAERLSDRLLLVLAERDGAPVGAALHIIGGDTLYGRYWGCAEYHPFLHFELCYYRAIDFAIACGLNNVEAGAQGEHKLSRGYEPTLTRSAHWIADPGFRQAISRYLDRERAQIETEIAALGELTPYRKD